MANSGYDTLSIKIEADSKQANTSIKNLSTNLRDLDEQAKKLDTARLKEVRGLLQSIAKIDFSNVTKGLQSVVSAFKSLNAKSASKSVNNALSGAEVNGNYPQAEDIQLPAIKNFPISSEIKDATAGFEQMYFELDKVRDAFNFAFGQETQKTIEDAEVEITNAKGSIDDIVKAMEGADFTTEQINAVIRSIKKELSLFNADEIEILRNTLREAGVSAEQTEKYIKNLKMEMQANEKDEKLAKALENLGFNVTQVGEVLKSTHFETNSFSPDQIDTLKISLMDMGYSAEEADDIISRLKKDVDDAGEKAKKSANGFKKLLNQFNKIMKYRIIRKIIQEIYKALQEGITNIASFDSATQDTLERLSAKFNYLKNSIGAMFAPLIQIVAPILETLMGIVGEIGNQFAEFFAGVNGQTQFAKANDDLENFNKTAKKTQALGIDELNVLQQGDTASFTMEDVDMGDNASQGANALKEALDKVKEVLGTIIGYAKKFIKGVMPKIMELLQPVMQIVGYILDLVDMILKETADGVNNSLIDLVGALGSIFKVVATIIKVLMPILSPILRLVSSLLNVINSLLSSVFGLVETIFDILAPILDILTTVSTIIGIIFEVLGGIIGGVLQAIAKGIETIVKTIKAVFQTVVAFFTGDTQKIKGIWEDLGKTLKGIWVGVCNFFIRVLNAIIDYFEKFVNWFIDVGATIVGWFGVDTSGWGVKFTKIEELSSYASGGFPEDGLFFANHNELVGQFSNGQTAVANNEQITKGIYEAVLQAMRESGGGQDIVVNLDGYELARVVTKKQKNYGADVVLGNTLSFGK